MVIRLSADDGAGSIELFGEDKPHHLVGERQSRERQFLVGTRIEGRGEAVRAADDEDQAARGLLSALKPRGQFYAAQFLAVLVEEDDRVANLNLPQDEFSLLFFLLFLGKLPCILQVGNDGDGERHVVGDAADVVINACREVAAGGLADEYQFCLHSWGFSRGKRFISVAKVQIKDDFPAIAEKNNRERVVISNKNSIFAEITYHLKHIINKYAYGK